MINPDTNSSLKKDGSFFGSLIVSGLSNLRVRWDDIQIPCGPRSAILRMDLVMPQTANKFADIMDYSNVGSFNP